MQVITNNHERQFVYRYDVPASVLASDLDWTTEEEHLDRLLGPAVDLFPSAGI